MRGFEERSDGRRRRFYVMLKSNADPSARSVAAATFSFSAIYNIMNTHYFATRFARRRRVKKKKKKKRKKTKPRSDDGI